MSAPTTKFPISLPLVSPTLTTTHSNLTMLVKKPTPEPHSAADGEGGGASEENPLAIVPSEELPPSAPTAAPAPGPGPESPRRTEVDSKISAWEAEEVAKISSRFQRQKAIIDGWEGQQLEKANASFKKIERKLEEKRARAVERMRNEVAIARQKAEERRAEAKAKREEKVRKTMEIARVMKAFGRDPSKHRSFF